MPTPPPDSRSPRLAAFLHPDMRFAVRACLLGALPTLALLTVLVGSLSNAVAIVMVSTICTAGIGGLFWIGVMYLLGAMLQVLIPSLRGRPAAGGAAAGSSPAATGHGPAATGDPDRTLALLIEFADAKLRGGVSEERVRLDLERAGWGAHQVAVVVAQARLQGAAAGAAPAGSGPDAR